MKQIPMFKPTHLLTSRSKQVPVRVLPTHNRYCLATEQDWVERRQPAFELHPKLGFFCRGIAITGYSLQPILGTVGVHDDQRAASNT